MALDPSPRRTLADLARGPLRAVPGDLPAAEARGLVRRAGVVGVWWEEGGEIAGVCTAERLAGLPPASPLGEALRGAPWCRAAAATPLEELLARWRQEPQLAVVLADPGGRPEGIADLAGAADALTRALALAEARLAGVMATVDEAVTVIDADEAVVGWNRRAEELYGVPAAEILGRPIRSVPVFGELAVTRVARDGGEVRDAFHRSAEGTYVLINARPIGAGGRPLGGVAAERDVTDLVALHQALARTSSQVREWEGKGQKTAEERGPFRRILGHNRALQKTIALARRVAPTAASVLLRGESGTGKELFAEAIHGASPRADGPFVALNCGAIPHALFESELFGYQPGAFTGADRRGRPGRLEAARGGTLFLDEVGDLLPDHQVKLLRVLQDGSFYRVGGDEPVRADVRVVAATHRDLEALVAEGRFREDLYYRLNVVALDVPPLRDRRDDLPELVYAFLQEFARLYGRRVTQVAPEVLSALVIHPWPGNVRELRNAVERLVVLAEGEVVTAENLPTLLRPPEGPGASPTGLLARLTDQTERDLIRKALGQCGGNMAQAARLLGVPRSTLYYKVRALGLAPRAPSET